MESEQTAELATALAKAQSAMGPAIINRVNPHFKNRYADLAAVFTAIKPIHDNGLSFTQTTQFRDGAFILRTTLRHTSGQWIASEYPLPLNAKPQEVGSALTYAKRYSLSALVGIAADEDDDGEATRKRNGNGEHHVEETGELITPEQIQTLRAALKVRELNEDEWKKRAGKALKAPIADLSDIPASAFQRCLNDVRNVGAPQ